LVVPGLGVIYEDGQNSKPQHQKFQAETVDIINRGKRQDDLAVQGFERVNCEFAVCFEGVGELFQILRGSNIGSY